MQPQPQPCAPANMRAAHWAHSVPDSLVFLAVRVLSPPSLSFSEPAKLTLRFVLFLGLFCVTCI